MNKKPKCPHCKSNQAVVPIQYGYGGIELKEAQERGELKIGGCVIGKEKWHCRECEENF